MNEEIYKNPEFCNTMRKRKLSNMNIGGYLRLEKQIFNVLNERKITISWFLLLVVI